MSSDPLALPPAPAYRMEKREMMSIISYAALSGLAIIIPLPFVDDAVSDYFLRRMTAYLADGYRLKLTPPEIAALATGQGQGCLLVLFRRGLWRSVRSLARKLLDDLFFLWAVREVAQRFTHAYYHGYLLDYAFRQGYGAEVQGNPDVAMKLNWVVKSAHDHANTRLFTKTIEAVFKNGWKVNRQIAVLLAQAGRKAFARHVIGRLRFLRRRRQAPPDPQGEAALRDIQELPAIQELTNQLYTSVARTPEDQLEAMKARVRAGWQQVRAPLKTPADDAG